MKWFATTLPSSSTTSTNHQFLSLIQRIVRRHFFMVNAIIIFLFWTAYMHLGQDHFNGDIKTPMDAFYYTIVTHVTLGYGDITPKTQMARRIVTVHSLIVWAQVVLLSVKM